MELQDAVDIKTKVTDSVVDVFDTMLSLPVEVVEEDTFERPEAGRLVGAVNFAGKVEGLFTIDVSDTFSRRMAAAMLGVEVDEIGHDDEIKDLIGEISNIVGGNLKSALTDAGFDCSISTPSITLGNHFTIESLNMDRFQRFVFGHEDHRVYVEVGLKSRGGRQQNGVGEAEGADHTGLSKNFEAIGQMDLKTSVSESLTDVFDTMLSLTVEVLEEDSPVGGDENRLVGTVNLTGEIMGLITIGVSDAFARLMTAAMLGIEVNEIQNDDEIKDLLGEISNIVGGSLKSAFTDAGIACSLSPPSITFGTDFRIESLNMETYDRFSFGHGDHRGLVEVGVKGLQALKESADAVPAENDTPPAAEEVAATSSEKTPSPEAQEAAPNTSASAIQASPPPKADNAPGPVSGLQLGGNLDLILDIPLEISVELGRTRMKLNDLLEMHQGSVVELAKLNGEPVDILANDKIIAKGEVVVENEKYGIRITEILSRLDRIKSLR